MDLTDSDDEKLIFAAASDFLSSRAEEASARVAREEPEGFSVPLWKEMAELGWQGLSLPENYGGSDQPFFHLCLLIEALGWFQIPTPLLTSVACSAFAITEFGTASQRDHWIPSIVRGSVVSYVSGDRTEHGKPSQVRATATASGFRLCGSVRYVPFAGVASAFVVLAHTPDGAASLLLVDAATPGISCQQLDVVGHEPLYRVTFSSALVSADQVLGPAGRGAEIDSLVFARGAVATCAEMSGGAQRVRDMTVEYACHRYQFGRPIGSFQAVQHLCCDIAVDALAARLSAYEAIWRLSERLEATRDVMVAKAFVSDAYQRICARGHQVHGAIGFTGEHDLHLYSRHASAAALAFGDTAWHTGNLARDLGLD